MIRTAIFALAVAAATPALAGTAQQPVLDHYLAEARKADPGFAGFQPARGEALFRSRHTFNADAPSCTTCHTDNPAAVGRHAKTGRPIDPVAVSANPKRFTDLAEVEKRFTRDCKSILGRECTAAEKGDYVSFMAAR
jgi:mono/diheme cytochrome c family protein